MIEYKHNHVSKKFKIHFILINLYRNKTVSISTCRSTVLSCHSNQKRSVDQVKESVRYLILIGCLQRGQNARECVCVCSDLSGTINASFETGFSVRVWLWTYSFCFHINKSDIHIFVSGWNRNWFQFVSIDSVYFLRTFIWTFRKQFHTFSNIIKLEKVSLC